MQPSAIFCVFCAVLLRVEKAKVLWLLSFKEVAGRVKPPPSSVSLACFSAAPLRVKPFKVLWLLSFKKVTGRLRG